jgi:HK97 family phage major capsid protein
MPKGITMLAVDYMRQEKERQLDAATALTEKADSEARNLTDDEKSKIKDHLAKAADFEAKIKDFEDNEAIRESIKNLGAVVSSEPTEGAPAKSIGEAFVKSEAYTALKKRGTDGKWSLGPVHVGTKANTGFVAETEGDNADIVFPQRVPGIQTPVEQRLLVADLFGQGTVGPNANSVTYVKETATDNAAAQVAEGDPKPPSYLEFTTLTTPLVKLASTLTVTDEILEDESQMSSYLNQRLSLFVQQAEEAKLVADLLAAGIGSADETNVDGDNLFDAILAAITDVRVDGGLEPDGLLISPMDFAKISVLKAQTGGLYYSGGPYAGPAQNPWGLRSVITTAVADGSPVVGAFRQGATVWRKGGGVSISATNSHEDYFERNLVMIRGEERVALTVIRPAAFVEVSLSAT